MTGGLLSLGLLLGTCVGSAQAADRPNVVMILTDDQRADHMSVAGHKFLKTPHMDRIAAEGARFTNMFVTTSLCSPSRASMLSGLYAHAHGVSNNFTDYPTDLESFPKRLQSEGYETAYIGKWHMGYSHETTPNQQGFDYSYGHMGGCIDNYSHFFYWQGPNRHDLWRNGKEIWEDGKYFPQRMVEEIGEYLDSNQNNPFFLYWALNIPHYPLQGTEKWRNYYKDLPSPRRDYAALVSTMDEKIGEVISKLKELGLEENTIIVFQSDHGHSEEERTFGGGGFAGPYRGAKFSLFEGGVRIPAIISWPGKIPQNEVRDQLSINVDWFPTLLELTGISKGNHKIDGKSIVNVIQSSKAPNPHDTFIWQSGGGNEPQWAVRHGDWKLIHNPVGNHLSEAEKNPKKLYLFNIKNDPGEMKNEEGKNPAIVSSLYEKYLMWLKEVEKQ